MPPVPSSRVAWALLALCAVLLRLVGLGDQGLWADEAAPVMWAGLRWDALQQTLAQDTQAPLYFLVMRFLWVFENPPTELLARLPSALFGLGVVWVVARMARRHLSSSGAWFATACAALSPMLVHYSREVRAYELLVLWCALALDASDEVLVKPRAWFMLVLSSAMALYTHNVAAFYLPGIWALLWWRSGQRSRVVLAGVVAVGLYAPWAWVAQQQARDLAYSYAWMKDPFDAQFPWQVLLSTVQVTPAGMTPIRNGVGQVPWPSMFGALLLWGSAGVGWVRGKHRNTALALGALMLTPWVLMFALSCAGVPFYGVGRVDVPGVVPAALLLGLGAQAWGWRGVVGASVVAALFSAGPLDAEFSDTRSQERTLAVALSQVVQPGDRVVVATVHKDTMDYYLRRHAQNVAVEGFPLWRETNAFFTPQKESDEDLAQQAAAWAQGWTRGAVLTLTQENAQETALWNALQTRAVGSPIQQTGYLGLRVRRFETPPSQAE